MSTPPRQTEQGFGAQSPPFFCTQHQRTLDHFRCLGHEIPVRNGIPRFTNDSYAEHFGEQWKKYRLTQLDSYTGSTISRKRLYRCLGDIEIANRNILECGCGAGRFTEILLNDRATVTSVDLSSAVDANAESFPVSPRHRIAQADILNLPFAPRQFDVVLCLGVIQHTPDPEATIAALYEQVRPGGWLVIDHYKPEPLRWFTRTAPLFRAILKRLDTRLAMRVTEYLTSTLLPIHKFVADKRLLRPVWHRISPVLSHYVTYPELNDDLQYQWALLDTHDSLTDYYKHWRTTEQIRHALERLGAVDIVSEYGGNGVEARGRRPAG